MTDDLADQFDKKAVSRVIRAVLDCPVEDRPLMRVGKTTTYSAFRTSNVDVKTRIAVRIAGDAMNGDVKAADFLMKYGGYEPPKETTVHVELPKFIDDLPDDELINVTNAVLEESCGKKDTDERRVVDGISETE